MFANPATLNYQKVSPKTKKPNEIWFLNASPSGSPMTTKPVDVNWNCQLEILSAIQGVEVGYQSRQRVATTIKAMDDKGRAILTDFLFSKNGVIASTLENNACKDFTCTPEQLDGLIDPATVDLFLGHWNTVYNQILPNATAMLYGLQTTNLNVRRQFLSILRDRVVVRLLANLSPVADKRVRRLLFPVLFALDVQTLDNSSRYWHFKKLMCSIMGVKVRSAGRSFLAGPTKAAAAAETAPCQPMRTLRSVPRALNRRSSEVVLSGTVEKRSSVFLPSRQTSWNLMASVQETASATTSPTTMRKRSVHWFDDNSEVGDDSEVYV